ncbi:MAG: [Fe-Fe] hydrogenase large subunit C-terminal domain-containing protein, partial [Bacillota bacterium]|nr:[Fe-Fe] hydrogenase large subunit C-terminal domain-containing protein [Bacillota bacterium]
CLVICPQNARRIVSDLEKVKNAVNSGRKLVCSLAPSFSGSFDYTKIVPLLRKLGFTYVEETSAGAYLVTENYKEFIKKNNNAIYITTACPSVNFLIEKYFPSLVKYLLPTVSPMIAHGKLLKYIYGEDAFVVFIGPCAAKKIEVDNCNYSNIIDGVLTYDDLNLWINSSDLDMSSMEYSDFDNNTFDKKHCFPQDSGIIQSIDFKAANSSLVSLAVSGAYECIDLFNCLEKNLTTGLFIEASLCSKSCLGGPNMITNNPEYYYRLNRFSEYIKAKKLDNVENEKSDNKNNKSININLAKNFCSKSIPQKDDQLDQIKMILNKMGKYGPEDELNCGVCGYNTCREKAKAVYEGMAEIDMCLNFMRNKAESLTNVIFENTANSIILLDGDMNVKAINPAAEEAFLIVGENIIDKPISILINDTDFRWVKETKESITGKKVAYPQYNLVFIQNIVYLSKQDLIIVSMINVVENEKNQKELLKLKENTLNAAQEVIDKQMRVAQEIASLLGETTAE